MKWKGAAVPTLKIEKLREHYFQGRKVAVALISTCRVPCSVVTLSIYNPTNGKDNVILYFRTLLLSSGHFLFY